MRYRWLSSGDVNAFFGLMLDNVGDMILMAALLTGVYKFPSEFVLSHMIPGTALGVLVGDLLFTFMAFRLAKRERRSDVTAMPLGLDTPSTFGAVFLILGPAYTRHLADAQLAGQTPNPLEAARHAWYIGIAMLLASGVFKLLCAPLSGWIRNHVPRAGLLGSLVAIALVIISFLPLLEIAITPVAGFTSLLLILATITARWELRQRIGSVLVSLAIGFVAFCVLVQAGWTSWRFAAPVACAAAALMFALFRRIRQVPGVLLAVAVGCAIYYAMHGLGLGPGPGPKPALSVALALPFPMPDWCVWFSNHWREALGYLPVAIPLALATVVGGIDCVESASAAGDRYPTGPIIAGEGIATLVGGLFGGVIQSTPYIGHPAYKAMGGRAGYTLATALFVGAVGLLGMFGWIFHVLPKAVVFPILVFVGIEITQHSFRATSRKHYPALVFSCVPALAYLAFLTMDRLAKEVDRVYGGAGPTFGQFGFDVQQWIQVLVVLSSGFIITSLLWGAFLAHLIDGKWKLTAGLLACAAVFSLCGIMHSPLPGSPLVLPNDAVAQLGRLGRLDATGWLVPHFVAASYGAMAVAVLLLGAFGSVVPGATDDADPAAIVNS
jgi:AGZA family xanthine/uracil permease-like MFS transporter